MDPKQFKDSVEAAISAKNYEKLNKQLTSCLQDKSLQSSLYKEGFFFELFSKNQFELILKPNLLSADGACLLANFIYAMYKEHFIEDSSACASKAKCALITVYIVFLRSAPKEVIRSFFPPINSSLSLDKLLHYTCPKNFYTFLCSKINISAEISLPYELTQLIDKFNESIDISKELSLIADQKINETAINQNIQSTTPPNEIAQPETGITPEKSTLLTRSIANSVDASTANLEQNFTRSNPLSLAEENLILKPLQSASQENENVFPSDNSQVEKTYDISEISEFFDFTSDTLLAIFYARETALLALKHDALNDNHASYDKKVQNLREIDKFVRKLLDIRLIYETTIKEQINKHGKMEERKEQIEQIEKALPRLYLSFVSDPFNTGKTTIKYLIQKEKENIGFFSHSLLKVILTKTLDEIDQVTKSNDLSFFKIKKPNRPPLRANEAASLFPNEPAYRFLQNKL